MTLGISSIVATFILVGAQKYLSKKQNWLLGAIVPLVSAALMAGIFLSKNLLLSRKTLLPCILIIALEIFIWIDQRLAFRREEIHKMRAKDL